MARTEHLKSVESIEPIEQAELKPIGKNSKHLEEHKIVRWVVYLPPHVTKDNLLDSRLWTVVSDDVQRFHRITAISHDGLWTAEIMVVDAGRGRQFQGKILAFHDLPAMQAATKELPPGYAVEQDPQTLQWRAIRLKDKVVMVSHATSYEDARKQLVDHASLRN